MARRRAALQLFEKCRFDVHDFSPLINNIFRLKTESKQNAIFPLLNVFRLNTKGAMKTIRQYEIAAWLGVKPATLANIFCENRRPSRHEAKRLESISGVSFEDWMLSNGSLLRQKVFTAWAVRRGEGK